MQNLLKEFSIETDKLNGFYRGQVVNNNDLEKLGRVQVKVYPHMKDLENEDLPWAEPCWYFIAIPPVNSWVWIFFQEGEPLKPVYMGQALPVSTTGKLLDEVEKCSSGEEAGKYYLLPKMIFEETEASYPNSIIFRTINKSILIFHENGDIEIAHPSGSKIVISTDITIHARINTNIFAGKKVYISDNVPITEWCE